VFPMNLIEQEVSADKWIDIPEEILNILYRWRPTPLRRATYLEKHINTPARIYYNENMLLTQAIENGARGAYWHILRKIRNS